MATKLASGDVLPAILLQTVKHGEINLPADVGADFAVVLFYRGHW